MIRMNDNLTHHFVGTTWFQYCWKRSQNMEHEISQMNSAFDLEEIRELRGVQKPWLTSEQFKDTLVEYRLTKLMVYTRNLHNLNSISVRRVGLSSSNLFSGTDWYLVNESDKGRQTFFFTPLNLIGGDPDEEEPVMTAQFLKVSALSQSSRAQDQELQFWQTVSCDLRAPSCASRVRLHSNLSERRSNTVRKTLNTTSRAKSHTERQLAIEAAATTAVSLFVSTCGPVQGNLLRM